MITKADPHRRAELLERAIDYVHEHGLAGLSLRPLAAAMGTSARMLLYHFGSKERLIADALDGVRARQQAVVEKWLADSSGHDFGTLVRRFWLASAADESMSYGRLFFEAYGVSLVNPDRLPGFLESAVGDWLSLMHGALVGAGLTRAAATSLATAALGVHRGLLLDLLATGDRERVNAAHEMSTRWLEDELTRLRPSDEYREPTDG